MVFDVARVRGLYVSLSDGWTYLNAHESPQIPEKVSGAVARSFRMAPSVAQVEPSTGSHSRSQEQGRPLGKSFADSARWAIADLVGASADCVVLGPNLEMLYRSLADALPFRSHSVVLSQADSRILTNPFRRSDTQVSWAQPDLGTGDLPDWQFRSLITGGTRLVSFAAAHPYVGAVVPVEEISNIVHERSRAWVLVDATAVIGYRPIDMDAWGVDILAFDCAAMGGPNVSALVFRDTSMFPRLTSLREGVEGPEKLELGRMAAGMLGGVATLVDHMADLDEDAMGKRRRRLHLSMQELNSYLRSLNNYAIESLRGLPRVHLVGISGEAAEYGDVGRIDRVPRLTFVVHNVPAETVQQRLAANGLVTTVSPNDPLLNAMGVADAGGAVTIGLAPFNTTNDIDQLTRVVASLA